MSNDAQVISAKPDFADWLSPMLVKELRQGMRSRVFLLSFLAVQAAMIFLALMGLLKASVDDSTTGITAFFWVITGLPILLIMPFSGLGSIAQEKTANTLDLIFLTRLTARRIVFGKWVAIVAQTALLLSAILPYAVMRYYLGGVNITAELTTMAWMLAGSALLTAITVGLSPSTGRVGRVLMPFAAFIGLYILIAVLSEFFAFGGGMGRPGAGPIGWQGAVALVLQGCFLALSMMEVGAGKIGPIAENHSTPNRLLALASVLTAVACSYLPHWGLIMWLPALFIAGPAMIGAVCEPIREVPSIYRPFLRLGFMGRALGRLLYPGWQSGVLFALLLFAIAGYRLDEIATGIHHFAAVRLAGAHVRLGSTSLSASVYRAPATGSILLVRMIEVAYLGAFFFPVALFRGMRLKMKFPTAFYFVAQGLLALLALIGILFTEYGTNHVSQPGPSGIEQAIACIPACTLFLSSRINNWNVAQQGMVMSGISVVTIGALLLLLVRMWPAWRTISTLEKNAASLPPAAPTSDAVRSADEA